MRLGPTFRLLLLFAVMLALFMAAGWVLGSFGLMGSPGQAMLIFGLLSAAMNLAAYWWSDRFVLWSYRAKVLAGRHEEPRLWDAVARAARQAGLPMPRVAVVPMDVPNAFATGRSPRRAVVAATRGILHLLDDEELDGVLAHELAHVGNRDMLVMSVVATVAGAVMFAARMLFWNTLFGGNRREGGSNPLGIVVGLAFMILAPIAALLVQLAVSRTREYKADATGARLSGKPHALAAALQKMERIAHQHPLSERQGNTATASLFIVNPFRTGGLARLFSTHPPVAERVRRLQDLQRK